MELCHGKIIMSEKEIALKVQEPLPVVVLQL